MQTLNLKATKPNYSGIETYLFVWCLLAGVTDGLAGAEADCVEASEAAAAAGDY